MKVNLIKKGEGLFPSLEDDQIMIDKIKHDEILQYDIKRFRGSKFHRKFFALLQMTISNSDLNYNTEQFLHVLKLKLGYFDLVVTPKNEQIYIPKSISWASMDQDTFEVFYKRTLDIILSDFITGSTEEEIQKNVSLILNFA